MVDLLHEKLPLWMYRQVAYYSGAGQINAYIRFGQYAAEYRWAAYTPFVQQIDDLRRTLDERMEQLQRMLDYDHLLLQSYLEQNLAAGARVVRLKLPNTQTTYSIPRYRWSAATFGKWPETKQLKFTVTPTRSGKIMRFAADEETNTLYLAPEE